MKTSSNYILCPLAADNFSTSQSYLQGNLRLHLGFCNLILECVSCSRYTCFSRCFSRVRFSTDIESVSLEYVIIMKYAVRLTKQKGLARITPSAFPFHSTPYNISYICAHTANISYNAAPALVIDNDVCIHTYVYIRVI